MNNGIVWLITIIDRSSIDKSSFNLSYDKACDNKYLYKGIPWTRHT